MKHPPMKPLFIRPWFARDVLAVGPMIEKYFRAIQKQGAHMLPSPANVELAWNEGLQAANLGDPTYVAIEPEGQERIVGYIHAADVCRLTQYQLDMKLLQVFGVYTLPSQRGQMVYVQLLRAVGEWMRRHEYDRVISTNLLQNPHLLEVIFLGDVWPVAVVTEWQTSPLDSGLTKKGVGR